MTAGPLSSQRHRGTGRRSALFPSAKRGENTSYSQVAHSSLTNFRTYENIFAVRVGSECTNVGTAACGIRLRDVVFSRVLGQLIHLGLSIKEPSRDQHITIREALLFVVILAQLEIILAGDRSFFERSEEEGEGMRYSDVIHCVDVLIRFRFQRLTPYVLRNRGSAPQVQTVTSQE